MRMKPITLALAGTMMVGQGALMAEPAAALTPVSELRDVSPDHWAYNAIQTLVEKYQVMEGFPDKTFRGSKTLTRYEMAAALAKVMARVEERIAIATGQPINVDPGVNPEDLRTIARLQREFREELDQLKSRVDTIDSRVMALEKRVKISGVSRSDYRDFTADPTPGNGVAGSNSADFRFRNSLNLDAQITDDLGFAGTLNFDLYSPQSAGNSFLRGPGGPYMDVYTPNAILSYNPGWINYAMGVGALRNHLALGSSLPDPFKMNLWTNGLGGYGYVGTPGVAGLSATAGATQVGTLGVAGVTTAPAGGGLWLPGTDVITDLVDPNNSSIYGPHGDLLSTGAVALGPLRLGLGFSRGALTGPQMLGGTTLNTQSLPTLSTWNAGSRATVTAGLDFGLVRLNGVVTGPGANTGAIGNARDKWIGGTIDIGGESLGLTAEVIGNTALNLSNYQASRASIRLGASNVLDTGFAFGIGMVTGNAATMTGTAALGGLMEFQTRPNSIFAQPDFSSAGLMLKTPSFMVLPSFSVAAQQTGGGTGGMFGALSGAAIGSGFSIGTEFPLFGLPAFQVEYSQGKFGATGDQGIFSAAPFTHGQVAVGTQVKF